MKRIAEFDLPDRLAPYLPVWIAQLLFGLFCAIAGIAAQTALDSVVSGTSAFALGFPAMLIATLFARWPAGVLSSLLTITWSWYFLLPVRHSFGFEQPKELVRLALTVLLYAAMLAIAELFRRAVHRAATERDRQIAERDLFLEEFDHRVRNNFQLVTSLLQLQRDRTDDDATADALGAALNRVESIARAHHHLYRGSSSPGRVDMQEYLPELCTALADALLLHGGVTLSCHADAARMPRDRAVSIGLVVNEAVTNAAKHAFCGRDSGTIEVGFHAHGTGWQLKVRDDGAGMSKETLRKGREGGLGQRLIDGFARQAKGKVVTESGPEGTVVTLNLAS